MLAEHDRAFKEWAVACDAMQAGRQIALIRKGGIREDEGEFRITDREFFLMPTHEHQDAALLQAPHVERLAEMEAAGSDPGSVRIAAYAVVDSIAVAHDDEQALALADEHIWNERYVKMRLDYNPYDPLYVLVLRVYNLPEAQALPMRPEYAGCKSWVTLDRPLSTAGAAPAIADEEFARRRATLLAHLQHQEHEG